jgi:hypothetical protein
MLTFLGPKQRFCDGMSRRGFLTAGALSLGGLTLSDIHRLKAQGAVRASRLKSMITDLHQRGMDEDVAVVVWGEMGRTPRINGGAGRDHWNDVGIALVMGGGLKMGQVIGATTSRAERSLGRPYTPKNLLATLYADVLGIDPGSKLGEMEGRPMPVLQDSETITELRS